MKLYIITRQDLHPGAQLAQSVHAMRLFVEEFPDTERQWFSTSNNLVCLSVPDESALRALYQQARQIGYEVSCFKEPDFGEDVCTAIALSPAGAALVANLPLALRAHARAA